jgi:uncharacterized membrane protein YfcA
MWVLAAFALAGGLAQFIDGTLGMGFGVTSATILLFLGISPVTASAATHAAKLPTTLVSGFSHWRGQRGHAGAGPRGRARRDRRFSRRGRAHQHQLGLR